MNRMNRYNDIPGVIRWWLFAGLVLIFMQILIGGITRLTGSGLSITKWEIVTGTLPPMSEDSWQEEFDLYKATPQYEKINQGLSMSEFKFIYFWEYFHRLWARLMGFAFIIPIAYFLIRGMINKPLLKRLITVFVLAGLVATFGWIMVASGLVDRPWVNAYKLSMHLALALLTFSYLLWTFLLVSDVKINVGYENVRGLTRLLLVLVIIQIFTGALVAGMRAAMVYPSWPDMNGEWVPSVLMDRSLWTADTFLMYDKSSFMPALTQFVHRLTAYLIFFIGLYYFLRLWRLGKTLSGIQSMSLIFIICLFTQVVLGILTVINAVGQIPVFYGVAHQSIGIILLSLMIYFTFKSWQVKQIQ